MRDYDEQHRKRLNQMHAIRDLGVGMLILIAGILLLSFKIGKLEDINRQLLGGLFVLYGIWRVYRGYKKNYSR
jgi:hypothetical protein